MLDQSTIQEIESLSLADAIRRLADQFAPGEVVFSSSLGQEDQVLTDCIAKNNLLVKIFTIDTGRLFNETYELLEKTTARYRVPIDLYFPNPSDVEGYVKEKGVNAFYESVDNRKTCCHIRKVVPLNRALQGAKVWITGLRAGQSDNRQEMKMIEWLEARQMYKFNPLIKWGYDQVREYIRENDVPYNKLHDQGFISIGCAPCTRAIEPGEEARAGRWWWEASHKECGLHVAGS